MTGMLATTCDGGVLGSYEWMLFVHLLAAAAWLGGLLYSNVMMFVISRSGDPGVILDSALRVGKVNRLFLPPAGLVTVGAGAYLAGDRWEFSQEWVMIALVLALLVIATAIFFFVPELKTIEQIVATDGPGPAIAARLRRIGMLARVVTLVLIVVLLLMVWKPGA